MQQGRGRLGAGLSQTHRKEGRERERESVRVDHRRVELERWLSVERRVEDPGEHRVGFMVMALGGCSFGGVWL